jgi:hypothetical protein
VRFLEGSFPASFVSLDFAVAKKNASRRTGSDFEVVGDKNDGSPFGVEFFE